MNEQLISVIIPIYNSEKYLAQCLDSVVCQTYKNIEVILIDDGSTDASSIICDSYADRDTRVHVIHQSNQGQMQSRKNGVKIASGNLITFIDSDDWIDPDHISNLYECLMSQNVDLSMCGRVEEFSGYSKAVPQGIQSGRYDHDALRQDIFPYMIVNGSFFRWGLYPGFWDKLFRKDMITEIIDGIDPIVSMGDDAICTYPLMLDCNSIFISDKCTYHYRQTNGSVVHSINEIDKERYSYRILYQSGIHEFEKRKCIYDEREKWREYVLFLMTARCGDLYEGMADLDYLFPFSGIRKGSRVIIYGMGVFGNNIYSFLKRTGFCNVAACADLKYMDISIDGCDAISPDDIGTIDYDYIAVCSSFADTTKAIYRSLSAMYPTDKIALPDNELILSDDTMRKMGII